MESESLSIIASQNVLFVLRSMYLLVSISQKNILIILFATGRTDRQVMGLNTIQPPLCNQLKEKVTYIRICPSVIPEN